MLSKKKIGMCFLLFLISFQANAQQKNGDELYNFISGIYIDDKGNLITDHFDPDYETEAPLFAKAKLPGIFIPGVYYDLAGKKTEGWLKYSFDKDKISFKNDKGSEATELITSLCTSYVLGPDSFVAIKYYKNNDSESGKDLISEFALVIDRVDRVKFYKSFRNQNGNLNRGSFFMKHDTSIFSHHIYENDISSDKYASSVFEVNKKIISPIFSKCFNTTEHIDLVALHRNEYKLRNNEKVFFDLSWNYILDSSKAAYYANVVDIKDSIVSLRFFRNDNEIVFQGNFSFDLPGTKSGQFIYYYPNGSIRKKVIYTENKPDTTIIYHTNGKPHFSYCIKNRRPFYYSVFNRSGESEITREGFGIHVFYDSLGGRVLNYCFKEHRLTEAFYVDSNGVKTYQYCGKGNAIFKYAIQGLMNKEYHYPRRSLANNHNGYMLIKCFVEPNGMVSDFNVIRGIDAACDSSFSNFFSIVKEYKHFSSGIADGKKVRQEIVIPVYFKADFFSAKYFYKTELPIERNTNPVMFPEKNINRY
jgi:hypothetical protein